MSRHCENYQLLLCQLIDEELDGAQSQEVHDHLAQCPQCAKELKLLQMTCLMIKNLANPKAPPDFLSKLRRRIDAETSTQTRGSYFPAMKWLMAHPAMAAASFTFIFVFAFVLGRFTPAPQITAVNSELEPAHAWRPIPTKNVARADDYRAAAEAEVVYQPAAAAPVRAARMARNSLATPVSFSSYDLAATAAAPMEAEVSQPMPLVGLQTPTQLIITVIKGDPVYQNAAVYPIRQGAVVQTSDTIYRITISDQNFINALRVIAREKGIPASVELAQTLFKLDVEKMPSPLAK